MTYAALIVLAPHLAALCPTGDDHAAADVYAASIAPRPAIPAWTAEQADYLDALAADDCGCGGHCDLCDPDSAIDRRAELLAGRRDF